MKKLLFNLCFLLPIYLIAQQDSVLSGLYSWKTPSSSAGPLSNTVLFTGKAHDMEWVEVSANTVKTSQTSSGSAVPSNEEHLIIVKAGRMKFVIGDSIYLLAGGGVALLMPGERYSIQNTDKPPAEFYLMKYRSKKLIDLERSKRSGGSAVLEWDQVQFKPHDKGGRRNFFDRPTAMCERFEMHVTTLNVGFKSHDPHTHAPEEIILVTEGKTKMQISDKFYPGQPGSLYYAGSNVPHAIENTGKVPCTYFAFQFE
jgi:(S)-ureidoglycine aminohydrolase